MDETVFEKLRRNLPPAFYRSAVPKLVPGQNAKTLANHDSAGTGPKGAVRIGRNVLYDRDSFVDWLEGRAHETES
ncbi:conserved hypothetical protein [uncultured Desulfatiglans sp.]|nr:conserved hypothetical protein [uncultured Desulfatiglans sp.]